MRCGLDLPERDAMTTADILGRLSADADCLRSLGVRRLALFGSASRGEDGAGSDLDFLVELDRKTVRNCMDFWSSDGFRGVLVPSTPPLPNGSPRSLATRPRTPERRFRLPGDLRSERLARRPGGPRQGLRLDPRLFGVEPSAPARPRRVPGDPEARVAGPCSRPSRVPGGGAIREGGGAARSRVRGSAPGP